MHNGYMIYILYIRKKLNQEKANINSIASTKLKVISPIEKKILINFLKNIKKYEDIKFNSKH